MKYRDVFGCDAIVPLCALILMSLAACGWAKKAASASPPPPAPAGGRSGVWRPTAGQGDFDGDPAQTFSLKVDERVNPLMGVVFQPGDIVTIRAGGCVNTKRYGPRPFVNPTGRDADRLYHGTLWIPGATPGLVRIAGWQGRQLVIPASFGASPQIFLRQGYESEEEDYAGNNLNITSGGDGRQCSGMGPAYLQISVRSGAPPAASMPIPAMNLVTSRWDDNLLPLAPYWSYWDAQKQPVDPKTPLPDAQKNCGPGFPVKNYQVSLGVPPCSVQSPAFDHPAAVSANKLICGTGGFFSWLAGLFTGSKLPLNSLTGHVNWAPATYTGPVEWDQRGPDGDLNIQLKPDASDPTNPLYSILTIENQKNVGNAVELEFNDLETVYAFHETFDDSDPDRFPEMRTWWARFRDGMDAEDGTADGLIGDSRAVVTGLVGVDNEHGAHAELHPVFAIAIKAHDYGDYKIPAGDEIWPLFVRNWGNEGECSQDFHYLDVPADELNAGRYKFTFRLPWGSTGTELPNMAGSDIRATFADRVTPELSRSADGQLRVTFHNLPSPKANGTLPIIEGELHLQWANPIATPPHLALAAVLPKRLAVAKVEKGGEDQLQQSWQTLGPAEKKAVNRAMLAANKAVKPPANPAVAAPAVVRPAQHTAGEWKQFRERELRSRAHSICTNPNARHKPKACNSAALQQPLAQP